jgi:Mg2+ and Co2+ transporter CorA
MPKISLDKIENTLDETREDISLAKGEIITRIKEVETEVCSDIVRKTKELKEDNVSTRNLVRQKSDKVVKFATKQLDTMERIEKEIEDTENEIKEEFERVEQEEKEIADMFDEYELEEEEIKKEFDKLDSNT